VGQGMPNNLCTRRCSFLLLLNQPSNHLLAIAWSNVCLRNELFAFHNIYKDGDSQLFWELSRWLGVCIRTLSTSTR
jgi:hypothetical protein